MYTIAYRYTDESEPTEIEDWILSDEVEGSLGDLGSWYGEGRGYLVRDMQFDVPDGKSIKVLAELFEKLRGRVETFVHELELPEGVGVPDYD